jgi:hypothetical protein
MKNLKEKFEAAANAYLMAFCEKHGYDFDEDCWIGGRAGGIADLGDTAFANMETIRADMDMSAPEEEFGKWSDYCLRLGMIGVTSTPNFEHWIKGCPRKSEEEIRDLERLHDRVREARNDLEKAIKLF